MRAISFKGHLAMFGANVIWGLMSPSAKFVLASGAVTPLVLTDLRIAGAMVLFWFASIFQKWEKVSPKDLAMLFGAALLGIVFNQGTFIFGVGLTTPGNASIITTSMPLWAMLLAAVILKEPITGKKIMGITAGACGALLLIMGSHSHPQASGGNPILGDILVTAAQFSYAAYLVIYKDFVNKYSLLTIMKWMFTYAFLCLIPLSAPEFMANAWATLTLLQIVCLAFIVIFATFLAYLLIVIGQKNLRPTVAAMYNYIQPVVACIVAVAVGMDSFNIAKGVAVLLIFGGVYLVTMSNGRREIIQEGDDSEL